MSETELLALRKMANPEGDADWFDQDDANFYARTYELLPSILDRLAAAEERARKAEEERDEARKALGFHPANAHEQDYGCGCTMTDLPFLAKLVKDERDQGRAAIKCLQERVTYYEEAVCMRGNPLALPVDGTETEAIQVERVAEVLTGRDEARAEVERLERIIAAVPVGMFRAMRDNKFRIRTDEEVEESRQALALLDAIAAEQRRMRANNNNNPKD